MASHRRTIAAAVATILASISLYPVFIGAPLWFWDGAGAVLVVAAAGTLTRVRRLPVAACLAVGAAALLLYLNAVFSSGTSLGGVLPTGTSLNQLASLAGQGFSDARGYAPPVPQLNDMLLLAVGGIGIVALLTDLIAVRLESAALAGLPLLLLFIEPFTVSASRNAVGTTVAFCLGTIGYLGMLSSEGKDRIREWEHPNPDPNLMPDTRALAAAGRRVGTASVVLALFVPLVIPGLHATQLFGSGQPGIGGTGGGSGGVGFPDPDTQLSSQLHASQAAPEFLYTSSPDSPEYFQIYVLDNLTDTGWKMFAQPASLVAADQRLPAAPGLTSGGTGATRVTTRVTMNQSVGQDYLGALPVPYPATSVSAPGSLQADRNTLMVLDNDARLAGLSYSVSSVNESPPAQAIDAAKAAPADITSHYTEVPASYQALRGLADSVVKGAGAKTQFEEAVALQDWLANGTFRYTLNAPTVVSASGLANFLEHTKQGYCQQFSYAMAVLARLLGIPSRVAYGFTGGTSTGGTQWLVTSHDAHAWPELYFQGFGWLRFEPTPPGPAAGQGTATTPGYTISVAGTSPQSLSPAPGLTQPASGTSGNHNGELGDRLGLPLGGAIGGAGGTTGGGALNTWELLGLSVLGLLAIGAATPAGVRLIIRRRRWRARADAGRAHAAWRELRDDLVDYGVGYLPSESPRAAAARAAATLELGEPATAALRRIAMAEERARYAARADSAAGLRHDSAAVRRAVAAAVPRWTRWRARLLPSSVLSPALAAVSQAADIFGRLNPDWFARPRMARPENP